MDTQKDIENKIQKALGFTVLYFVTIEMQLTENISSSLPIGLMIKGNPNTDTQDLQRKIKDAPFPKIFEAMRQYLHLCDTDTLEGFLESIINCVEERALKNPELYKEFINDAVKELGWENINPHTKHLKEMMDHNKKIIIS